MTDINSTPRMSVVPNGTETVEAAEGVPGLEAEIEYMNSQVMHLRVGGEDKELPSKLRLQATVGGGREIIGLNEEDNPVFTIKARKVTVRHFTAIVNNG